MSLPSSKLPARLRSVSSAASRPHEGAKARPWASSLRPAPATVIDWALRLTAALGLAVDAAVHADLAPLYDGVKATVSQGELFRVEAAMASAAALFLLVGRGKWPFVVAFCVAAGGLAAVLLYRYVNVGVLGPFPDMYEPSWYGDKTISAVAEVVAALACTTHALLGHLRKKDANAPR